MKRLAINSILVIAFLLLPAAALAAGQWITTENGVKIWGEDLYSKLITQATWTGDRDQKGFATGSGIAQWFIDRDLKIKYIGTMVRGKAYGEGYCQYTNGSYYQGGWVDGKRSGKGTYKETNGSSYEGDWAGDKRNGKGKEISVWGDYDHVAYYEGDFVNDKHHGYGKLQGPYQSYRGFWVDDKPHGAGVMTYANGDCYEGEFAKGHQYGKGVYKYANGDSYQGEFVQWNATAKGIYKYANGEYYEGEFVNGKFNGYGTLYSKGGTILKQGRWVDGNFSGN